MQVPETTMWTQLVTQSGHSHSWDQTWKGPCFPSEKCLCWSEQTKRDHYHIPRSSMGSSSREGPSGSWSHRFGRPRRESPGSFIEAIMKQEVTIKNKEHACKVLWGRAMEWEGDGAWYTQKFSWSFIHINRHFSSWKWIYVSPWFVIWIPKFYILSTWYRQLDGILFESVALFIWMPLCGQRQREFHTITFAYKKSFPNVHVKTFKWKNTQKDLNNSLKWLDQFQKVCKCPRWIIWNLILTCFSNYPSHFLRLWSTPFTGWCSCDH